MGGHTKVQAPLDNAHHSPEEFEENFDLDDTDESSPSMQTKLDPRKFMRERGYEDERRFISPQIAN